MARDRSLSFHATVLLSFVSLGHSSSWGRDAVFREIMTPSTILDLKREREALERDVIESVREEVEKRHRSYLKCDNSDEYCPAFWASEVLGELFDNAVRWGNQFERSKRIKLRAFSITKGIVIEVEDEGALPFDPMNDPCSFGREDEAIVRERRKQQNKMDCHGLFWTSIRDDAKLGYLFRNGSIVSVLIEWRKPSWWDGEAN